jgi:hypothetical protein
MEPSLDLETLEGNTLSYPQEPSAAECTRTFPLEAIEWVPQREHHLSGRCHPIALGPAHVMQAGTGALLVTKSEFQIMERDRARQVAIESA